MRRKGPDIGTRYRVAVRRNKLARMRLDGHSWQACADALGYRSRGAACQDMARALADLRAAEKREYDIARARARELRPLFVEHWVALFEVYEPMALLYGPGALECMKALGTLRRHAEAQGLLP